MNYIDTDTTLTDSSEYGLQNETERCPITGVSTVPGYMTVWLSSDSPVDSRAEHRRSNSKLEAMFDKFLYRK